MPDTLLEEIAREVGFKIERDNLPAIRRLLEKDDPDLHKLAAAYPKIDGRTQFPAFSWGDRCFAAHPCGPLTAALGGHGWDFFNSPPKPELTTMGNWIRTAIAIFPKIAVKEGLSGPLEAFNAGHQTTESNAELSKTLWLYTLYERVLEQRILNIVPFHSWAPYRDWTGPVDSAYLRELLNFCDDYHCHPILDSESLTLHLDEALARESSAISAASGRPLPIVHVEATILPGLSRLRLEDLELLRESRYYEGFQAALAQILDLAAASAGPDRIRKAVVEILTDYSRRVQEDLGERGRSEGTRTGLLLGLKVIVGAATDIVSPFPGAQLLALRRLHRKMTEGESVVEVYATVRRHVGGRPPV